MKNFIIKINRALAAEKRFYVVLCASLVCAMNVFAQATPASDSKDVNCGSSVTITATPVANYHFVKWQKEGVDVSTDNPLQIDNIKAAATYTAIFDADVTDFGTEIEIEDVNGDPVALPVAHGTTIYLSAQTDDCHNFHWDDLDPTDPNYRQNPRPFVYEGVAPTFSAVMDIIIYNVTVNADDATHGTVQIVTIP